MSKADKSHTLRPALKILLALDAMTFSKSFGYAVRGMLYIAVMQQEKRYVQVGEIAGQLGVPKHFMGKILKNLVKEEVLTSVKGPTGGFALHEQTLGLPLIQVLAITDGLGVFSNCVLRLQECNASNPCPMHYSMETINTELKAILSNTTIGNLLNNSNPHFIKSLSTKIDARDLVEKV